MVKRTNQTIAREFDKLTTDEQIAVIKYISQILSIRSFPIQNEAPFNDDLIASLSEKRENRRAQQVVEWERVRRRSIARAA